MKRALFLLLTSSIALTTITSPLLQADLLDTAFQPSKNLDHVLNLGNDKNAVGNEVFRGGLGINGELAAQWCYKILPNPKDDCDERAKREEDKCYQVPAMEGVNKDQCSNENWAARKNLTYVEFVKKEPLLVRIAKTLLRITIALAIPMIIFAGVKTITTAFNWGDYKDDLKNVWLIIWWLALALSAVGIIYLIQSLMTHSLSGSIIPF